jgi:erythromycin esterase-like protein
MNGSGPTTALEAMRADIRGLATPLDDRSDLQRVVAQVRGSHVTCLGEASHGTSEFYRWRGALSRRLIEDGDVRWIGVEGDWPDCWRINQWVRGRERQDLDAVGALSHFERWPTWMWANHEVAEFLAWLREWNRARPERDQVGFYGLDVYSLWDSLRVVMSWLRVNAPDAVPDALRAWRCFLPYGEDPHEYARGTRLVPMSCEPDVISLLVEVRRRTAGRSDEAAFDAVQNAEVAAGAERYYRIMVRGDRDSWNIRDHHMTDTIARVAEHHGPDSRGLVWEHNTHVGDARGTDMARHGMVNVGQLLRERLGPDRVSLVGFAGHRGTVLAASGWGRPERVFPLPAARAQTHEDLLHHALGRPAVLTFGADRTCGWLTAPLGHRAVGVVYDPAREAGNYVPTRMGARYDALVWFERTEALHPLRHEAPPLEPEFETEPSSF